VFIIIIFEIVLMIVHILFTLFLGVFMISLYLDPLAYLAAKTHGFEEQATALLETAGVSPDQISLESSAALLKPPTPLLKHFDSNWPLLTVSRGFFEGGIQSTAIAAPIPMDDEMVDALGDWGGDDLEIDGLSPTKPKSVPSKSAATSGANQGDEEDVEDGEGWGMDDIEIPDIEVQGDAIAGARFVPPSRGRSLGTYWVENSSLPADHIAAGSFETAMAVR